MEAPWVSSLLASFLTFITVLAYYGVHEVARDLEDPFIRTHGAPNELPCVTLQNVFNRRALASWRAAAAVPADGQAEQAAEEGALTQTLVAAAFGASGGAPAAAPLIRGTSADATLGGEWVHGTTFSLVL